MGLKGAIDCNGNLIKPGDKVVFLSVEESLLSGLPLEDQEAIKAQKGEALIVTSIDEEGFLEIEFEHQNSESEVTYHTMWVAPQCFEVVKK